MDLSRSSWIMLGAVTLGLAILASCGKIDADELAKKIAADLKKDDRYRRFGIGDDQPIVVAGGSMNLIAPVGLAFVADTGKQALTLTAPAGTVITKVDVIDPNDTPRSYPITGGTDPQIKITYDKKKGGSGSDPEVVTISASHGTDLAITSDTKDMSTAHSNSDRFWSHPKKHKSISKVQVGNNTAVQCGNDGECSLVIHYCTTAVGVTCIYH
jgi:hypothetical protein